ncbi:optineurin isoform X2 [Protopterus annectens]|nr:optineurin isoform X2 [Protopterus annectens]
MDQLKAANIRLQAEKADLLGIISELQLRLASSSGEDSFVEIPMIIGEEPGVLQVDKDSAADQIGANGPNYEAAEKGRRSEDLTVSQLLHLLQEQSQKEEKLQQHLRAANDRVLLLEKKASELSEKGSQTEWAEEDQEKKAAASQAAQEIDKFKAQVAVLQKEVQDIQVQLNAAEQTKKVLEQKCQTLEVKASEALSQFEEKQQLQYASQKLVLQVESMQSEIKMEQTKTAVEKKKLADLQLEYNQFRDDSNKTIQELKNRQAELEEKYHTTVSDLSKKLELAENALAKKQGQIDEMLDTLSKNEEEMEAIPLMKTQMEIYCADFHAEREARQKIHEDKERLGVQLEFLVKENSKLREDLDNLGRQSLAHMQQRHGAAAGGNQDQGPRVAHRGPDSRDWQHQVNIPEHACPKCGEILPDIDSLQIHVMDCII